MKNQQVTQLAPGSVTVGAGEQTGEIREAARGGAISILGAGTSAVMGFVLTLVLARSFGAEGSGVVLQAIAVFSIVLSLARTGMDTAGIWILPRLALADPEKIRGAVVAMLLPTAVVGAAGGLFMGLVLPHLGIFAGPEESQVTSAIALVSWFLPCGAVMMVALAATRGLGNVVPYTVVGAIAVPLSRPVAVLAVASLGGAAAAAAMAWALPMAAAMVAALVALWIRIREHERRAGVRGALVPDRAVHGRIWKFALPRWFSSGIEASIVWFDVILVGSIAGAGAAGVYGAASRFVTAGLIISTAMRMVISPRFSALLSENRLAAVQKLYATTVTWIVLLGAPIYGLFMFFAPTILGFLGDDFERGSMALIILCLGAICSLLAGNVDSVLMMSGRSGWMLANKSMVLAINVIGNIIFVPRFGISGAAVVWAVSMAVDAALASIETRIFIGVRFEAGRVFYALLVAAASVVPASVGALLLMGNSAKAAVVAGIVTMLVLGLWCLLDRRRLGFNEIVMVPRGKVARAAKSTDVKNDQVPR